MSEAEASDPRRKNLRPPWPKGVSGNLNGRPRNEPRVRRYARRYDRRMCKVLAEIAQDTKLPAAERRRAAMDLVSIGSGRPALVQEITGRDGEQLAPLVSLNFPQPGQPLTPEAAYAAMIRGELEPDPHHPAFRSQRPPIEGQAAPAAPAAANARDEEAEPAAAQYGSPAPPDNVAAPAPSAEPPEDLRIAPLEPSVPLAGAEPPERAMRPVICGAFTPNPAAKLMTQEELAAKTQELRRQFRGQS